tara:strand:+ start:97 stop:717 length:621 start_codon:yes stop_codon:yes gene_type:complete
MTYLNATVQSIFTPSFIVFKNLNLDNNQILKELNNFSYQKTSVYGNKSQRSDSIKVLNEMKSGDKIKKEINLCLDTAIKKIWKYDIGHTIVNSWVTKTNTNCDSDSHSHKNFWLSAVYYPYSPGKFKIRFESDRFDLTSYEINVIEYNCFNSTAWDYEVFTGDLVVFSAALRHKIYVNTAKDTRYSIAINILPKGKIGTNDGALLV